MYINHINAFDNKHDSTCVVFLIESILNTTTIIWKQVFHHPNNPTKPKPTTTTHPIKIQITTYLADTTIKFTFNISSSPTIIHQILQLLPNSVYPTIFILNHNLITYTILRTMHLQLGENSITIAKSPPKRFINKSNQRSSIHRKVQFKRPKKPPQQSAQNTEAKKS